METITTGNKNYKSNINSIIFIIISVFVASLSIIRLFDSSYWGDEAFSILLARMSIPDMIQATANDVHPPFYYLVIRLTYLIFGDTGFAYHLSAVIPVLLMIVFSMTVIRKKYGKKIVLIFILLGNFLGRSLLYNVEIRMYSWAYLFVTLCYWYGSEIIENNKNNKNNKLNWCCFTLSGLLSAYTHYYALITVAFIMLTVYILSIKHNKKNIKNSLISFGVCVVCYLPWLTVLLQSFKRSSDDWWSQEIPSLKECLAMFFSSDCMDIIVVMFTVVLIALGFFTIHKNQKKEKQIGANTYDTKIKSLLMIVGIGGTLVVGYAVSYIIRPLFLSRYCYQLSGMIQLCVSIIIVRCINKVFEKIKFRQISSAVIILAILLTGCFKWYNIYKDEVVTNKETNRSVEKIKECYQVNDRLETDEYYFTWTVLEAYNIMPNYKFKGFTDEYLHKTTWIMLQNEVDDKFVKQVKDKNGTIEFIENGKMDWHSYYLYKVVVE